MNYGDSLKGRVIVIALLFWLMSCFYGINEVRYMLSGHTVDARLVRVYESAYRRSRSNPNPDHWVVEYQFANSDALFALKTTTFISPAPNPPAQRSRSNTLTDQTPIPVSWVMNIIHHWLFSSSRYCSSSAAISG